MIEITHYRATNGKREEPIKYHQEVFTLRELEAIRETLKKVRKAKYVDFIYKGTVNS